MRLIQPKHHRLEQITGYFLTTAEAPPTPPDRT